jgi:hypothetical protein
VARQRLDHSRRSRVVTWELWYDRLPGPPIEADAKTGGVSWRDGVRLLAEVVHMEGTGGDASKGHERTLRV